MTTSDDDGEFGMKKILYKFLIICFSSALFILVAIYGVFRQRASCILVWIGGCIIAGALELCFSMGWQIYFSRWGGGFV